MEMLEPPLESSCLHLGYTRRLCIPLNLVAVVVIRPRRTHRHSVQPAFHDADTDILARMSARMSVSVSASWNAGLSGLLVPAEFHVCCLGISDAISTYSIHTDFALI